MGSKTGTVVFDDHRTPCRIPLRPDPDFRSGEVYRVFDQIPEPVQNPRAPQTDRFRPLPVLDIRNVNSEIAVRTGNLLDEQTQTHFIENIAGIAAKRGKLA